jgi:hypothetical protein
VVVAAVGEIGKAYAPKCASTGCSKRSVERATRSWVFVRPPLLVIDDRVLLENGDYGVVWAAHLTQNPKLDGAQASAVIGDSRVELRTLEPERVSLTAPREPTPSGEGSHRLNQPWGPMWRLEAVSPRGERERSFLHVISALPATAPPVAVQRLNGDGLRGGAARGEGQSVAVLFASSKGEGNVALGGARDVVVVAGLEPGKHYGLSVDAADCRLRLSPSRSASDASASAGGFVRTTATQCGVK